MEITGCCAIAAFSVVSSLSVNFTSHHVTIQLDYMCTCATVKGNVVHEGRMSLPSGSR